MKILCLHTAEIKNEDQTFNLLSSEYKFFYFNKKY